MAGSEKLCILAAAAASRLTKSLSVLNAVAGLESCLLDPEVTTPTVNGLIVWCTFKNFFSVTFILGVVKFFRWSSFFRT
jgi:hypothetical protein